MGVTSVSAWTGRREGKGREGPGSINIISSSAIHSRIGIRINIEIDIFPNHLFASSPRCGITIVLELFLPFKVSITAHT